MNIPSEIRAGDTLEFSESLSNYSSTDSWDLKFILINSTNKITFAGVADGSGGWDVEVAAATTADYTSGVYQYQAYVELSGEIHTVETGTLKVLPSLIAASTLDTRSHVKKVLDALEAVIESRASKEQEEIQIAGRAIKYISPADLRTLYRQYKADYEAELKAEKIKQGLPASNRVLVQFKNTL